MSERKKKEKEKEKPVGAEENPAKKVSRKKRARAEKPALTFPETYVVIGADLSLRRPGYAILLIRNRQVIDVCTKSVDNKTAKKTRGEILTEIFARFPIIKMEGLPVYYVREHAFNSRGAMSEIGIFEAVGVTDVALWMAARQDWYEIYPVTVKKQITGSGQATKEEVAQALSKYIGKREYANDDESDAAAVAVAFLLEQNAIDIKGDDAHEQQSDRHEPDGSSAGTDDQYAG